MEFFKLISGIALLITFILLFIRAIKRDGLPKAFLAFDIFLGIAAGVYLIVAFFT